MKQTRSLWILFGVVLLGLFFLLPLTRLWSIANYPGYSLYSMMSGSGMMFFGMGLFWILLIIFLVLGILWFNQQLSHQRRK
ncbi:MAG TPA: hypothetical protein VJH37_01020 [Candidatus Nanoarchaeia archaeon]|nr:hypothetical protein [Candidatus Nanoarchaeia archaeon]